MKKLAMTILILMATITMFGCFSPNQENSFGYVIPKSEIYVQVSKSNGVNVNWIKDMAKTFEQENEQTEYHLGNKGVKIRLDLVDEIQEDMVGKSHVHLFVNDSKYSQPLDKLITEGSILPLDDVVYKDIDTRYQNGQDVLYSIDDKISQEYKHVLQGEDGKYYALPAAGERQGITYNVNLFNKFGFYLADPSSATQENSISYTCDYGSALFVKTQDQHLVGTAKKSCGNDGVFGTWDDGTPTSLEEFFILCEYMSLKGVQPITIDATNPRAKEYIYNALWATLSGKESYQATYSFNGEVEVVTGITKEKAFEGIDYIYKPTTQKTIIDKENGYLVNSNVNRYWGMSVMKIIEQEGWYSSVAKDKDNTRENVIKKFLLGGKKINGEYYPYQGMFIDTDRWYKESQIKGTFSDIKPFLRGEYQDLSWMSIPTKVYGTVEPNQNNKPNDYFEYQQFAGYVFMAQNTARDSGTDRICKEFLQYIYKDGNLSTFTGETLLFKTGMEYSVGMDQYYEQDTFGQSLIDSYNSIGKKAIPYISNLYNIDVDYYFDFDKGIDCYLCDAIKISYMNIYEIFLWSCTDTDEWEILKSGGRFEYDKNVEMDGEEPTPPSHGDELDGEWEDEWEGLEP
jgi:hypothetical protein